MLARDRFLAEPSLARAVFIDGMFTFLLAMAFLLGGWDRIGAPGYAFVRQTGGPYLWGSLLLAGVLALVLASRGTAVAMRLALTAGALVHALFGACFLLAALVDPRASFVGVLVFFWNAVRLMNQERAFHEVKT